MWWQRSSLPRSKRCLPDLVPPDEKTRHERLRIARDLHDTVAQRLAGLGYSLDATIADESIPSDRKRSLREIRFELSQVVEELRDEILALRSDPRSSIEEWLRERLKLEINWQRFDSLEIADREREEVLYVLLELLQNAISHQGITSIDVEELKRILSVTFRDAKAPVAKKFSSTPALGRVGLRERLIRVGADLEESEEGFIIRWQ